MSLVRALGLGMGLVVVAAVGAQDDKPKFDIAKAAGTYTITAGMKAGEKAAPENMKGVVIVSKEKLVIKGEKPEETFEFTYKIDASKTPAQIDMEIQVPEGLKGTKAKGIIEAGKGTLKLCYHPMNGDRPTKFESTKDNGNYLWSMTRQVKKDGKRKKDGGE